MQTNEPPRTRAETTILIAMAMLGAIGLNYAMNRTGEAAAKQAAAIDKHIRERNCMVADIRGRHPSLYVCQLPVANEYIEAGTLVTEAIAHHP